MTDRERLVELRHLTDEQAEDDGLWFEATTAAEAYLQNALRHLHAVIEETDDFGIPLKVQQPVVAVDDARTAALMDSQYVAGAKAGWNASQADDPDSAIASLISSRDGYLKVLKETRFLQQFDEPEELLYRFGKYLGEYWSNSDHVQYGQWPMEELVREFLVAESGKEGRK